MPQKHSPTIDTKQPDRNAFLQWDHSFCDSLLACSCLCLLHFPYRCPISTITVEEEHFGKEREVGKVAPGERQNGIKTGP